ncbi:regulator of microtubule dynamics protein 1-like [Chelonus insularis]|uniref:regulator of microtubule dynamics protein 1-like n=1 Tax=Chelonus insularis TaxID=460826 RepID=UPI00158EC68F|nr:regulator of microtubule dynamics protein 1-like [Chelonus insularis]
MSQFQSTQMITVALGATIGVIGAASLFIYQKIMEHREREQLLDNIESVNKRVSELQIALENLRAQQEQKRSRRLIRKRVTSQNSFYESAATDNEVDAISATETDVDDEFYDCSDDEVIAEDLENGKGVIMQLSRDLNALDEKIENGQYEEALSDLRSLVTWHENNIEVVWRLARAYVKNASDLTDNKRREELLQEGIKACEQFLDEEHADLHKWYAMLVGSRTEYLPNKEKLLAGKTFEKHVRLALKLRPEDPILNHLLGRFQYSVLELNWIQRKICETLFGETPNATFDEAIENLEKAEMYAKKPDIENKYYLGQSYLKVKQYKKGVEVLKELLNLQPRNKKEESMRSEAANLVSTYSNFS